MATVQERPKADAASDDDDEFGELTISGILEGRSYIARERYTVAQQEEIADIVREAMRAGARAARPDWELFLKVERVDDDDAA